MADERQAAAAEVGAGGGRARPVGNRHLLPVSLVLLQALLERSHVTGGQLLQGLRLQQSEGLHSAQWRVLGADAKFSDISAFPAAAGTRQTHLDVTGHAELNDGSCCWVAKASSSFCRGLLRGGCNPRGRGPAVLSRYCCQVGKSTGMRGCANVDPPAYPLLPGCFLCCFLTTWRWPWRTPAESRPQKRL